VPKPAFKPIIFIVIPLWVAIVAGFEDLKSLYDIAEEPDKEIFSGSNRKAENKHENKRLNNM